MTKTTNYNLSQWDPEDKVLRTDFNEDNATVDAALAQKCEIVAGTYTGNGATSQNINLGRQPKAVLLFTCYGKTNSDSSYYGGLALSDAPVRYGIETYVLKVTATGFTVYEARITSSSGINANSNGVTYHYIAFF